MPRRLQHLLVTTLEFPRDPRSWSGIPHSLVCALEGIVPRVTVVDGTQLRPRRTPLHVALRGVFSGPHPRWPLWMTEPSLRHYAGVVEQAIAHHQPDAVLSISSQCLARLHTRVPTYIFNDAPWLAFKRAYAPWETVPIRAAAFGRAEAAAARRTRRVFTGSHWAIEEGMRLYGLPRDRFAEAHLGANWIPTQSTQDLLDQAEVRAKDLREGGPMQLLFVGKDWERKGGPLAMEIAAELHGQGQPVHLHIVGCSPIVPKCNRSFITVHGVLDLGKAASRDQLEALFLGSHFLLVPTQAECFGIVFAESQGFAVPPVSRRVHALPSIILDGFTGVLMPRKAEASSYATRLREVVTDTDLYLNMATGGRERFLDEFTWQHTAQVIQTGIEATLV